MYTPHLVVDTTILLENIRSMQRAADEAGVGLRPHIKAHKCSEIMRLQLAAGAVGITTAKLSEAEVMAQAGATDIFIAYPIVGEEKLKRLAILAKHVTVAVSVDNIVAAQAMARHFSPAEPLAVMMEIDTGLKRCGVFPHDAPALAEALGELPALRLRGIFTHAGHVYGAAAERVAEIGLAEAEVMVNVAHELRRLGFVIGVVSTGSTPTARHNLRVPGITEIRPGNYVFNDNIQMGLGVVKESSCSLHVRATVVSRPTDRRCVIDAGSKVLGLDKGAHGTSIVVGFGTVVGHPELEIERLSEEHGVIVSATDVPPIGAQLTIIPNHACVVANLADKLYLDEGHTCWAIDARGRVE